MSRVWVCAFGVLATIALVGGTLSGLYIDNGLDQTMIHHSMTPSEKMVVESEILDLLGLPTRPRRPRAQPLNRSAPSFLLDVYKTLAEERQDQARPTRSSHLTLSGEEQQAIDDSDVIITFQSKNHHGESVRHERGRRLWFDVSEAPSGDVVAAELRLYQAAAELSDDSLEDATRIYTIVVHNILSVDSEGGLKLKEAASVNTTVLNEGWLELNVTSSFNSWLNEPETNHGLFVNVHALDEPEYVMKPEEVGVVSARGSAEKQPFLVAFLQTPTVLGSGAGGGDSGAVRTKRETKKKDGYSNVKNPFTDTSTRQRSSRNCQIQTLYVSFKDLEWQDWIIAPDGYGAFYCSGECNFPLNAHMNATNHAIVQTLVHLINPSQVPKPCCAPTKLTPISVLYFLDDANVILKKYKNMVVKSCGCH